MATYLQGVQDYIPQFQPFQPDLNLYANVLQTKQTEYDSAWKSLNNVYGQYFYADLTRDDNLARKEELIKNIDFNLKKVAGLDLSLDQNVSVATQVFKPFYEDKYLMKDMAWTKNFNAQKGRAMGLRNSTNEKMREQYWDGGVRALDYLSEEFREVSADESLGFQNASYTPYVNSIKKAQEIAKEAGLSIEKVDFSEDGRWIVKKKNGELLYEPLSKLFEASLGNDPAIQAVYKTQAYLDRKDYAYSNAAQFGGDKNAAEMKYLEETYNVLKQENENRYKSLKNSSESYETKIKDIEKQIREKKAPPGAEQYLNQLKEAKDINDNIIARIDKDNEAMKEEQGTPSTTSGFQNPYGDIKSLRWKVDNAVASKLMQKDLNEAAQIFAFKDAKEDIEANIYAVNEQKHAFSMQEIAARNAGLERAARIRNQGEMEKTNATYLYESGAYEPDMRQMVQDETGNMVANPNYGKPMLKPEFANQFTVENVEGSVTDKINLINYARNDIKMKTNDEAVPYVATMAKAIADLQTEKVFSDEDVKYIFEQMPGMTSKKLNQLVQSGKLGDYLMFNSDPWKIKHAAIRFQRKLNENSANRAVADVISATMPLKNKFMDYADFLTDQQDFFRKGTREVERALYDQGFKGAKYLYDEKGRLRSEKEFYSLLPESVKSEYAQITARRTNPNFNRNWRDEAGVTDQEIGVEQNIVGGRTYKRELNYTDMVNAAANIWSSGEVKSPVPGLSSGNALAQTKRASVNVAPKGPAQLPGRIAFSQFTNDYRKIDFDGTNSMVLLGGPTKTAYDTARDGLKGDAPEVMAKLKRYKSLVDAYITDLASGKTKAKNFVLQAQNIAMGSEKKGAMIIVPDVEWLNSYVGKWNDDTGALESGLITQEEAQQALTNGLTVISDSKNWTNNLYKSAYMTPFEAHIDYRSSIDPNYSYREQSPYDENTYFTIKKNDYGLGDYDVKFNWREWDPTINGWRSDFYTPAGGTLGKNLEQLRSQFQSNFQTINMNNTAYYNLD